MLSTFVKILVTICLAVVIKAIHDLSMFNPNASLIELDDPSDKKIQTIKTEFNPLLFKKELFPKEITLQSLNNENPGYIINDKNKLISLNAIANESNESEGQNDFSIHENEKIVQDLNLSEQMNEAMKYFREPLTMNVKHHLSLYRGNVIVSLSKNTHNVCLFIGITDNTTMYIFNPKHKNDIIGYTDGIQSIKKWGIKVILNRNDILSLPPEWFYVYEVNDESIIGKITADTYLTFPYNYLRSV